tara:strand:+ start:758 stop:913 length:156 start_codon:yes stop_codon:yes gene_type:complete
VIDMYKKTFNYGGKVEKKMMGGKVKKMRGGGEYNYGHGGDVTYKKEKLRRP